MTTVQVSFENGVAHIILNGPDSRNSLDLESAAALVEACEHIDADDAIGAAVISGAGGSFCSGASRSVLKLLTSSSSADAYEILDVLYAAFSRFGSLSVPTIAAISGAAVGAGLNLALAADIRVAADDMVGFSGFSEAGIHPGGGHFWLLERAVGCQTASALALFGEKLTAAQALRCGLVWDVARPRELVGAAQAMAERAAADPQLSRAAKTSRRLSAGNSWPATVEIERARQLWSLTRNL